MADPRIDMQGMSFEDIENQSEDIQSQAEMEQWRYQSQQRNLAMRRLDILRETFAQRAAAPEDAAAQDMKLPFEASIDAMPDFTVPPSPEAVKLAKKAILRNLDSDDLGEAMAALGGYNEYLDNSYGLDELWVAAQMAEMGLKVAPEDEIISKLDPKLMDPTVYLAGGGAPKNVEEINPIATQLAEIYAKLDAGEDASVDLAAVGVGMAAGVAGGYLLGPVVGNLGKRAGMTMFKQGLSAATSSRIGAGVGLAGGLTVDSLFGRAAYNAMSGARPDKDPRSEIQEQLTQQYEQLKEAGQIPDLSPARGERLKEGIKEVSQTKTAMDMMKGLLKDPDPATLEKMKTMFSGLMAQRFAIAQNLAREARIASQSNSLVDQWLNAPPNSMQPVDLVASDEDVRLLMRSKHAHRLE